MMIRWRGRGSLVKEQVANAWDSFVDLDPVGESPADTVKAAWLPLQSGQTIPLIGEDREQVDRKDPDEFWSR